MNRLKKIGKLLALILAIPLLLISILSFIYYAPDQSLEELKKKWTYPDSKFIDIDGMPVHHRITGSGETIVLIHGTGASLHTWEAWTTALDKEFKVISLDIPAFGLTGPSPQRKYSLDIYAEFLDKFLTKIGEDTISIAGNSLGGGIAWTYAAKYPEKVKQLILVDASGYKLDKKPPLSFQLAQSPIWSKFLLTITPKSLFKTSLLDVYGNDNLVTEKLVNRYYELYLRAGNRQAFLDRVHQVHYVDSDAIKTIQCPTLIMWGEADTWVPVSSAYRFQQDIPNNELVIYPGVGHVPMEETPLQSVKDVLEFLKKGTREK